ncbi:MAG TPA: restriction endonuclease subunit S [Phycisphaerales bacterium]|nr:restriction endonuclease subunit S [Phycisphaerales bacterium]
MSEPRSHPSGWSLVSLGDIGRLHCGQSPSVANVNRVGKGTPYVTGPDHWDGSTLTADKWTTDPRRVVPDGCIFITVKGAGVGTLFPGIACAIGRDVYAYEPGKGLSSKFVEHALRFQIGEVLRHAKGDIPGLSKDHILDHQMAIPSPQEQRRIVAKIEELFSDLDAGVAALERVRANLKRYRAAVLKAAVEGRLTEEWRRQDPATEPAAKLLERILTERRAKWEQDQLRKFKEAGKTPPKGWKEKYEESTSESSVDLGALPAGWCSAQIGMIADTSTGGTPSRARPDFFGGDVPWVKSGELGDSVVSRTEETISDAGLDNSSAKVFPAGTLCIALYGATVGKVGVLGIPAATNQAVCAMFLPSGINTRFAFYYLISIRSKLVALGKGGAQPNISNGIVRATEFPIPPVAEQAEIVAEVDRRLSVADAAETQVEHALQRAARLRQAILKRAFEGKLVPQDPLTSPADLPHDRMFSDEPRSGAAAALTAGRALPPNRRRRSDRI